ncbi:MAG: glycosyltransferase family 4 protein [Actinomycetota bacterium]
MPAICVFVRNQFHHDARVTRICSSLQEQGFETTVFAVAAVGAPASDSWEDGHLVARVNVETPIHRSARFVTRSLATLVRRPKPARAGTDVSAPRERSQTQTSLQPVGTGRKSARALLLPLNRTWQNVAYAREAGRRAGRLHPVAYHCNDLNTVLAGWVARRIHPAPLIYDSHELWPHRKRADAGPIKTFVGELADRYWARRADAVVTVNDSIAQHMQRRYRVRQVHVVRNLPATTSRVEPAAAYAIGHVPRPRLMYVGGVQTHRGLEELIDAMPLIKHGTLVVVGPGNDAYRGELEERARSRRVADRVVFHGLVPHAQLVGVLATGDIGFALIKNFCLSYYLSLPNKLTEYIHAGLPVVASDFPEMRSVVEGNQVGIVCDPSDPAAIARSVNELLADTEGLERMKANARAAARELNWELESKRLLAIYRELIPADRWPVKS